MAEILCTDSVLCFVAPSWLLWIVAGLILNGTVHWKHLLPSMVRGVMEYGKLRHGESKSGLGYLLTVPKRWFTHFYIWGVVWNYSLFSVFTSKCIFNSDISIPIIGTTINAITGGLLQQECAEVSQYHLNVFLVLLLLCVQVTRRLYECLCVSVFSNSRMHIVHYVLGLYFYTAVGLTALLHLNSASLDHSPHSTLKQPSLALLFQQFLCWYHVLAIALFLWASYHQHKCHKILADLRKPIEKKLASPNSPNVSKKDTLSDQQSCRTAKHTNQKYGMPVGDWFYYISCPHLFAEILIYLSLLVCQLLSEVACSWWLVVGHVTCSLFLSARQMHSWYQLKFEDYPKNRTSLFPGLC